MLAVLALTLPTPADAAATSLAVTFDGCSLRFVTVGGEGVADGFTATATVDGGPASFLWGSLSDDITLTNHVEVEFTAGSALAVQWVLEDDDENVLAQGTANFVVPACDPPYQLRIDKVANGTAPAGNVTVKLWFGLGDGGLDCGDAPPPDAIVVSLPASGGSRTVRGTVGLYCIAETDSHGATSVGYASVGGTSNNGFHVADVAYSVNQGAPVTRVVTVTNTYPGGGTGAQIPATGASNGWLVPTAGILSAAGTGLVLLGRGRRRLSC